MQAKLTDEDLDFMDSFFYSIAQAETLFSDFDNLTRMDGDKLGHIRLYQVPLISHEYIIDDDPAHSDKPILEERQKEVFQWRKHAGECFALGGRKFGKSMCVLKVDMLISMLILGSEKAGFTSYDSLHIRGILEDVIISLEHHPLLRVLQSNITRHPNYRIALKTGYVLNGINMNIESKSPGKQFFGHHLTRLYGDEMSFESEQVYGQRRDAVSEWGCIYRFAGMTLFTKYTPCGQIFYDFSNRNKIVNLPQTVNPNWDEKEREKALKDFGGESSMGYRIYVEGEVIEDGISAFDMARIRCFYDEKRILKSYEINKQNYPNFEFFIVVERPPNVDQVIIAADIGESAPTEIVILFLMDKTYRYEYNITLFNLTDKEQFEIFKWLGATLEANTIAIDCTDGTGRAIFRSLEEIYPRENLVWSSFNEKIKVDYERHPETKDVIFQDGQPVYKEEFVSEWSVKHLRDILYMGKIDLPVDFKFDKQINSVIAQRSKVGTRTLYQCASADDHVFQAFQVFSIADWNNQFINNKNRIKKNYYKGGI